MLFDSSERRGDILVVSGRRAEHIVDVLRLAPGDSLRVGEINGRVGSAVIEEKTAEGLQLRVNLDRAAPPGPTIELILALPRPIMLQRILKQAAVLGVKAIHLTRSRRVEKSFFHSPVLQPEKIQRLLVEGLEQAMDTRLPSVHIYHRFKPFVEDVVPTLDGVGLLAHPATACSLTDCIGPAGDNKKSGKTEGLLVAIGPEGGWSDYECECFLARGFRMFTMGPRILHVDTAVVALLAQLMLLQNS